MKKDMDLIRKIILTLESSPNGYAPANLEIQAYTSEQIAYHTYLLIQD